MKRHTLRLNPRNGLHAALQGARQRHQLNTCSTPPARSRTARCRRCSGQIRCSRRTPSRVQRTLHCQQPASAPQANATAHWAYTVPLFVHTADSGQEAQRRVGQSGVLVCLQIQLGASLRPCSVEADGDISIPPNVATFRRSPRLPFSCLHKAPAYHCHAAACMQEDFDEVQCIPCYQWQGDVKHACMSSMHMQRCICWDVKHACKACICCAYAVQAYRS